MLNNQSKNATKPTTAMRASWSLALICVLTACAGPPTTVHVTLQAEANLNPDVTGLANPVQTRVLLLKTGETFSNTDYFQLTDKEKTVLGPDLLTLDHEIMRPGQTRRIDLPVPQGTKFVAVAASFRNIDQGTWRLVTPLKGQIVVSMGAATLKLVSSK